MDEKLPDRLIKGRGATSNPDVRYFSQTRIKTDDGWASPVGSSATAAGNIAGADDGSDGIDVDADYDDEFTTPLRTTVTIDATRSIIARNQSPDIPFDRSINAYRGCEHGCVYCFARPSHAYLGLSPGLDFETQLTAKPNAPSLLREALAAKNYQCRPIAIGTNTDPYQPIERDYRITRGILEVLLEFGHPVTIVTKSALIIRDIDLLQELAARNLTRVFLSVTTLDAKLANKMEPRAATPSRRLGAIAALARAKIPVGVMTAPMIPALNDHELESLLEAARDAGAEHAGYVLLRLPLEIKQLFTEWLEQHVPDRADHVLSLIRQSRGGALNQAEFGKRFRGEGAYAKLLEHRFAIAAKRLGLNRSVWALDTTQFKPPNHGRQLALL